MAHDNARDGPHTFESLMSLPSETISHIFHFLDPQTLVRLQAVSKLFHAIARDPSLWRAVYANARLPLPPGPFAWQSTRVLQRALVRSACLAHTWTTEPLTLVSSKIYTGPRSIDDDRFQWVAGRWLVVSRDMRQLRARDVDTGAERVLWDGGPLACWATTAVVVAPLGHFLLVVLHLGRGRLGDPVKLLEFVIDDDTGRLSGPETFDVPTSALPREAFMPRLRVSSGLGPYAYISLSPANKPRQSLVFDPRHRQFYRFPRFRTQLDLLINYRGAWLPHLVEVYFTETHLFVLSRSYLIHGHLGDVELVQTFALPDVSPSPDPASALDGVLQVRPTPVVRELRLTHEALTRDTRSTWLAPIRGATVDATTGTTTLRFMHTYAPFYPTPGARVRVACTDYVLPPHDHVPVDTHAHAHAHASGDEEDGNLNAIVRNVERVLPIAVVSHDVFSVPGQWRGNLVDASPRGFVRGLCMVGWRPDTGPRTGSESEVEGGGDEGGNRSEGSGGGGDGDSGDENEDGTEDHDGSAPPAPAERIHKFTLDASGERCIAVVGCAPSAPWGGVTADLSLNASRHYAYAMDGTRGRMWYTKWDALERNAAGELVDRDVLAIVVDFR